MFLIFLLQIMRSHLAHSSARHASPAFLLAVLDAIFDVVANSVNNFVPTTVADRNVDHDIGSTFATSFDIAKFLL